MGRWLAVGINIVLRVALVAFLADAILNADDSRFADKGIEFSMVRDPSGQCGEPGRQC
jgi:hypothetical protein